MRDDFKRTHSTTLKSMIELYDQMVKEDGKPLADSQLEEYNNCKVLLAKRLKCKFCNHFASRHTDDGMCKDIGCFCQATKSTIQKVESLQ